MYLPGGQEVALTGTTAKSKRYLTFQGTTVAVRTAAGASGTTTIVADHHATGTIQVNQANNTLTRRYTTPYGETRGAQASWTGDHGFLDKPTDTTGLTAIGARYYDPELGTFISVDPIMVMTDPQQWNAYLYSNSNPVTYSDPTGLQYDGMTATYQYTHSGPKGGHLSKREPSGTDGSGVPVMQTVANSSKAVGDPGKVVPPRAKATSEVESEPDTTQDERDDSRWWSAAWDGAKSWASSPAGSVTSSILGGTSAVLGVAAIVATATGIGAPVGAALGVIAFGLGAVGTGIDCMSAVDISCGVGAAGTLLGVAGLGAAARAAKWGYSASVAASAAKSNARAVTGSPFVSQADEWLTIGMNVDGVSAVMGGANTLIGVGSLAAGFDY